MDVDYSNLTSLNGIPVTDLTPLPSDLSSSLDLGNVTTVWGSVYPVGMTDLVEAVQTIHILLLLLIIPMYIIAILLAYYVMCRRLGVGFA
ncbi:hypothetical protein [Methanorbis rubei]|uniref:Uncharacterized protein n=1 Tax=Methanorbis rubei TaxID=3028300 RepID=A0AAE4SCR9_9EURY|nr:hypothetical protein [Methanocorpusculaceae archaeon Cs1]